MQRIAAYNDWLESECRDAGVPNELPELDRRFDWGVSTQDWTEYCLVHPAARCAARPEPRVRKHPLTTRDAHRDYMLEAFINRHHHAWHVMNTDGNKEYFDEYTRVIKEYDERYKQFLMIPLKPVAWLDGWEDNAIAPTELDAETTSVDASVATLRNEIV